MITRREKVAQAADTGSYNDGKIEENKTLATADATATKIWSAPCAIGEAGVVRAMIVGMKGDGTSAYVCNVVAGFRRQSAGNVVSLGAATITAIEDDAGAPAVTVAANTTAQEFEIRVAGIAATAWRWECSAEVLKIK